MKTPIVYEIAGHLRCLLVEDGQKINIGRAADCDVQIDDAAVRDMEATAQFVNDCQSVVIDFKNGSAPNEQPLPCTLPLVGFDLVLYRPSSPAKKPEEGAVREIILQGLAPGKMRHLLKPNQPLLLGSNEDCDVVISSADCPAVQLALWAAGGNKVAVKVLDSSSLVDWVGRANATEAEMELPASLSLSGKMIRIGNGAIVRDEFGYDSSLTRANRSFSRWVSAPYLALPDWQDDPQGHFRHHLSKLNQWALLVVILAGILIGGLLILLAIKTDQTSFFLAGVVALPLTFVVQYLLCLFAEANLKLTFGEPLPLVSRLVPRILVVFGTAGVLVVVFGGLRLVVSAYQSSFMGGILSSMLWLGLVFVTAYQPWLAARSEQLLNLAIREDGSQSAADYYFSVVRYFGRIILAQTPLMTFILAAVMVTSILIAGVKAITSESGFEVLIALRLFGSIEALMVAVCAIFFLPVITHVIYVITVALAETGSAFFRLTEHIRTLAEQSKKR